MLKIPEKFTTVTKFSKLLALTLFILLPFLWYFIGYYAGMNSAKITINNPKTLDVTDARQIINIRTYDNNLKKRVDFKFGIITGKKQSIFFKADTSLSIHSTKVLAAVEKPNRYLSLSEGGKYIIASYGQGDYPTDISISDIEGNVTVKSLWDKITPEFPWVIKEVKYLGEDDFGLFFDYRNEKAAYAEINATSGEFVKNSWMELALENEPYPVKYYENQFGEKYTSDGYEYQIVNTHSMNIPIGKSTAYSGLLRRKIGDSKWDEYFRIHDKDLNAKNNIYQVFFVDRKIYVVLADQLGAGSGEGVGKIVVIYKDTNQLSNLKCFAFDGGGKSSVNNYINSPTITSPACENFDQKLL